MIMAVLHVIVPIVIGFSLSVPSIVPVLFFLPKRHACPRYHTSCDVVAVGETHPVQKSKETAEESKRRRRSTSRRFFGFVVSSRRRRRDRSETTTTATTLSAGAVGGRRGDVLDAADLHASTGKGTEGGLGAGAGGLGTVTTLFRLSLAFSSPKAVVKRGVQRTVARILM